MNLLNFNDVENCFKSNQPDIVILAAAKVGGIYANNKFTADFILENLKIQNNVIENDSHFWTGQSPSQQTVKTSDTNLFTIMDWSIYRHKNS